MSARCCCDNNDLIRCSVLVFSFHTLTGISRKITVTENIITVIEIEK